MIESSVLDRHYGKYRGWVTDNQDDDGLGRIRAMVPEVLGEVQTGWALPCAPYAGEGEGLFSIPPLEAGVWIEFEAGDLSRPIWSGCFWGKDQRPSDESGSKAKPSLKILRGHSGLLVALDEAQQTITLSDKDGQNLVTIAVQKGNVTIKGKSKVVVNAPLIELVDGASQPVVLGQQLLTYLTQLVGLLQGHLHPGELALGIFPVVPAPPQPVFPPPTPALVSTRVKSG
jgi:uncharacterized protein involved in type VI secretion and phage assembly